MRKRTSKAKPGELKVQHGTLDGETALIYSYGGDGASRRDGGLLGHFFEGVQWPQEFNLREELERRGYDISTLKFSIMKRAPPSALPRPGVE